MVVTLTNPAPKGLIKPNGTIRLAQFTSIGSVLDD
jgi:hypothetical protein